MQKNICLYRHGVDNDIIDSFLKFIRKNCVTEKTEKKMRNREFHDKSLSGCFRNRSLRSKNTCTCT